MEPLSGCTENGAPVKLMDSTDMKQVEYAADTEQMQKPDNSPKKLDVDKVSVTAKDEAVISSPDFTESLDSALKASLLGVADAKKGSACQGTSSIDDSSAIDSAGKSGTGDSLGAYDYRSTVVSRSKDSDESAVEYKREIDRVEELINGDKEVEHPTESSGTDLRSKDTGVAKKRPGTDLDYDVDPLEFARQVAMEAKREVEGRENSTSSSDKLPGGEVQQHSPDSAFGAESRALEDLLKDSSSSGPMSTDSSLPEEEDTAVDSAKVAVQEVEQSQITEVVPQDPPANPDKEVANFDLNVDVCSEDGELPAVVSASRAAAASGGQPVGPLQFEGSRGWKGSAATSAFQAAPRRDLEGEKMNSAGGSTSFLGIDLNLQEGVDEGSVGHPSQQKLPSGESSVGAHLGFDLNLISSEAEAALDWQTEGLALLQQNGSISQSPSSSASSKHPVRNIDLNDQPNDHSFLSRLSQNHSTPGARSDASVISIMGMKVEVNRNQNFEPGMVYSHPSSYGYNIVAAPGPVPPFSAAMYGPPFQYVPVVPQMMVPTPPIPPPFSHQQFYLPMAGAQAANGAGSSRSHLNPNTGLTLEAGGSSRGITQFLAPGPWNTEEFMRTSSQASTSSGAGTKRKEPDGGWEHYPYREWK